MRDILIILGMCVAAIVVGILLFVSAPKQSGESAPETGSPGGGQSAGAATAPASPKEVPFRIIGTGTDAQVEARKNVAARDEEAFARLWKMAHGDDSASMPEIDFSKEYVIGVFAGRKPSGGHTIAVSTVTDQGEQRTVEVTITTPGNSCIESQALTSPYQLIAVPVNDNEPTASDTETLRLCD